MEDTNEYKQWEKRRNTNTYLSYILLFMAGLETSVVSIVMLYYFQDRLNLTLNKARMYFSIAEMFNAVGEISGGIFIGRYIDRTRNLRLAILVNVWGVIVGNLLYSLPFNIGLIIFGRFLCGLSESLQVAFGGEFKRCYKDAELIQILGWNEIFGSIGYTIGPGAPVVFSWIHLKIGPWKIDKYNAINVFIALFTICIYIILWFKLSNSSKELDEIKSKYSKTNDIVTEDMANPQAQNTEKSSIQSRVEDTRNVPMQFKNQRRRRESCSKELRSNSVRKSNILRWTELFQIDILSLCTSYGIIRYAINSMVALISMYAVSIFHWQVDSLSWLNIFSSSGFYLVVIVLIRYNAFQGKAFYCYTTSVTLSIFSFANLLVPGFTSIKSYGVQMAYLVSHMIAKAWMFFQAQSAGKVLLFNTVTPENSGFIDGVRSTVGSSMRLFALGTSFLCFEHPVYFLLPLGIIQFTTSCVIFFRSSKYLNPKKTI